jgi:hypothetical protein
MPIYLPGPVKTRSYTNRGICVPLLADDPISCEIRLRAEALDLSSVQVPVYRIHMDREVKVEEPPKSGEEILFYTHGGG